MAITDELREYANIATDRDIYAGARLCKIADRIDREHRMAMEKVAAEVDESERSGFDQGFASADDWLAQNEDAMAAHGWVRLPLDADGVPIRIGDVMENIVCPPVHREVTGVGAECFYGWDEGNGRYSQFGANCYRHHRAPTVEDVLREFAREIDADAYGITDAKVAEFAAKLRLAE